MKLPAKLLVLLGLAVCSLSTMAEVKNHYIWPYVNKNSVSFDLLATRDTLCSYVKSLNINCGVVHGWGDTTVRYVAVSGDYYDKDIFLIKKGNGEEYIFPDKASAEVFQQMFVNAIDDPAFRPSVDFETPGKSAFTEVVIAVLYKENGTTKFLIFPNRWDDKGENHTYQPESEANLHLVSPF